MRSPRGLLARALARGWRLPLIAAVIAGATALALLLRRPILLPEIFAPDTVWSPVVVLLGLPVGIALAWTADEPLPTIAPTGVRNTSGARVCRLLLGVVLWGGIVALIDTAALLPSLVMLATVLGDALVFRAVAGSAVAWGLPLLHVAAAALFGVSSEGVAPWAGIIDASPGPETLGFALLWLFLGVVVSGRTPSPRTRE